VKQVKIAGSGRQVFRLLQIGSQTDWWGFEGGAWLFPAWRLGCWVFVGLFVEFIWVSLAGLGPALRSWSSAFPGFGFRLVLRSWPSTFSPSIEPSTLGNCLASYLSALKVLGWSSAFPEGLLFYRWTSSSLPLLRTMRLRCHIHT
jgi:hypothetical protein